MNIFDDVNNWEKTEGAELFSSILNVSDPVILDYGCGAGNYSFAASYAFGQKCKVEAVDINKQCLDYVNEKAAGKKISCITTVMGREDYKHDFEDNTFDLVIYADMFHGEEKMYGGLHRFVMIEEAKRTLKKLIDEISSFGFTYVEKNLEGIHFEKVYSPYYQQKGGVTFDSLERGKFLIFEK